MASTLLIGSCEPFSGKSAVVLGLARLLGRQGVKVLFGKPLATTLQNPADAPGASGGAVLVHGFCLLAVGRLPRPIAVILVAAYAWFVTTGLRA